jgi:hypothetical protein
MNDDVRKLPEIRRPDVRALLRRVGDGTVSSADLYRAYRALMAEQDREPVSKKALGMALEACGQRARVIAREGKNVRCRIVREHFMAPEDRDHEELSPRL